MKIKTPFLAATALSCGLFLCAPETAAQSYFENYVNDNQGQALHRQSKSAKQRVAAGKIRRSHTFTDVGQDYTDFKNWLSKEYGIDFGIDVSVMGQRGAPGGHKTSLQTIIYPYLTWQTFQNEYGTGTLNMAYNIVRYGGSINGNNLGSRLGTVTGINDYGDSSNAFDELYYSYQLGGSWNWLTLAFGQFPLYNFDGSTYDANQQVNFINEALSQNLTSTYSTSGVGAYAQITPDSEWTFAFGAQDASNIDGISVRVNDLNDNHYATFGYAAYSPSVKGLGSGQYSVLVYNQPAVSEQPETTNGWSLNLSQDIGKKWSVFARINGVSGHVAEVNRSYVLGAVYNDPLDRNPLDQIGFAAAYNRVDEKALGEPTEHKYEKVLEAYWAWGISKWMTITPDIQFYIDPALNPKSDYDTVFSLRTTFFF